MSTSPLNGDRQITFEPNGLYSRSRHATAGQLATRAVQALIDEADLTPKPALVDERGSGAHSDLTLALMHRSARSLFPCFKAIATASAGQIPSQLLRERLGAIGRMGESHMFAATCGANSHKGAIWSLGLLVAGAVLCPDPAHPSAIASIAASIAHFPDSCFEASTTHGARAQEMYGACGARGEARQGFRHVVHVGFPALLAARLRGLPEKWARLDALIAIMAQLDDTCLLYRGGLRALRTAQRGAQRVLDQGGTSTSRGMERLLELDAELLGMNASPGGSADLLAATLLLDSITPPRKLRSDARDSLGDVESWRN
jgi:triphosphoribosyl-dephospho-CoA synthase